MPGNDGSSALCVLTNRPPNRSRNVLPTSLRNPADTTRSGSCCAHVAVSAASQSSRVSKSATLFVVDEGVDTGAIVAQVAVPVEDDDDLDTLTERIKVAERQMLVDTLGRMVREGFTVTGRKVRIGS